MRLDTVTLDPPEGWEAHTSLLMREPLRTTASGSGTFRMNIQVTTRPAPTGLRLQVLGITQAKTLERDLGETEIHEQGMIEIAGREAYCLDYLFHVESNELCQVQLFTACHERLVSLTGTALIERRAELRERMEEVLASLVGTDAP